MGSGSTFSQLSSGVDGLDTVLNGGYLSGRMYLVRGSPGTGKSLLGQHFLEAGLARDETVVYVHGEETRSDIVSNAGQLHVDVEDANFLDLGPDTDFFTEDVSYELVEPNDIEDERFIDDIEAALDNYNPTRVFIDPITQFRHLEADAYQYRKRLLSLMRFLRERDTTVLASRTRADKEIDEQVESLADGIIDLRRGDGGRRIQVPKHRGVGQRDGGHGLEIRDHGLEVYPRLEPTGRDRTFDPELLSSGIPELDTLLGGGIERGSVTFFSGPTGVGKTTMSTHFAAAAGDRGEGTLVYLFEESVAEFTHRAEALGLPVERMCESGQVVVREVEPLARSAEEVAGMIAEDVSRHDPSLLLLDGMAGYKMSLQGDETRLTDRLRALTRSMKNRGIAVIVTDELSHITGMPAATSQRTSYIADNVVLVSYLERTGGLDRTVGVLKKRIGDFESQFRSFTITAGDGVCVGDPLDEKRGILSGGPCGRD